MYMDDVISSVPDVESAYETHSQLVNLFQSGGFPLLKWVSNSRQLLDKIPSHLKSTKMIEFDKTNLKILGLQWNPYLDRFTFKLNFQLVHCTKRNLLSCVARIFDPLGFLSPITLFIKLLIKKLWSLNFDWDQVAPVEISNAWTKFQKELYCLNEIQIPRHLLIFEKVSVSLIGFSDASMNAYAVVIYVRTADDSGNVNVNLLCSRSKVSPNSKISLPRLELCAATLLAQLLAHVQETYNLRKPVNEIYAFCDSMITLHWIHSTTRKWKPFVSNRVSKIKYFLSPPHWFFVPTQENVSDCASRGLTPLGITNHSTWLSGPTWLKLPLSDWPVKPLNKTPNVDQISSEDECVLLSLLKPDISPLYGLIEYFSSWTKLLHSTICVLRFAQILPHRNRIKADFEKSELMLIRAANNPKFPKFNKNFSKSIHAVDENASSKDEYLFIGSVEQTTREVDGIVSVSEKSWATVVTINDREVNFKLDTGAMANVIPVLDHTKYAWRMVEFFIRNRRFIKPWFHSSEHGPYDKNEQRQNKTNKHEVVEDFSTYMYKTIRVENNVTQENPIWIDVEEPCSSRDIDNFSKNLNSFENENASRGHLEDSLMDRENANEILN
ncbi:hypothetical protein NQ314_008349 [Rhamnusium bicolor]|uniref:Uncharacterized protein n=1 Tax=Rhamnusium bicolor TaxID=1586634 RepID=A0AAV8YCG9_9CUCU|nr:hypothetical protein NQ314_008349 [Rhamnusium bicolor]